MNNFWVFLGSEHEIKKQNDQEIFGFSTSIFNNKNSSNNNNEKQKHEIDYEWHRFFFPNNTLRYNLLFSKQIGYFLAGSLFQSGTTRKTLSAVI